jgi:hypothetical protein
MEGAEKCHGWCRKVSWRVQKSNMEGAKRDMDGAKKRDRYYMSSDEL